MQPVLPQIEMVICALVGRLFDVKNKNKDDTLCHLLEKKPIRLTQILLVLANVHQSFVRGVFMTKRSLFYMDPELFGKQEVPRWDLKVKATEKLRIFGDLQLETNKGQMINFSDCEALNDLEMIPTQLECAKLSCGARFILVVEKDTIFQKLMTEDFYNSFKPCLMVTAKGYPDLRTRQLLYKLSVQFPKVPILGLFDADPHGLGVYCTYKYGTQNPAMLNEAGKPVCANTITLLGLLPSELLSLQIRREAGFIQLSTSDITLLSSIQRRVYFNNDEQLMMQTNVLLEMRLKAEIEILNTLGPQYLCQEYLPKKLRVIGVQKNNKDA
ncbi:unnamed protein product [Calicophoron daubneyi]|uniref:DNA topoisomerase (ATP-hydrolyzing) n=1 Tax=Calicophoron daubneyi TaxID=300641 RepID=A0AAV2T2J3_CALDB